MAKLSRRTTAMAAELLADRLLDVYQNEQVPKMVAEFAAAGFTRNGLREEPDALFRLMIIAAYDRRPFTQAMGGYEAIWEIDGRRRGVPSRLSGAGLWTVQDVLAAAPQEPGRKLALLQLGSQTMADDGRYTQFGRTLRDAALSVQRGLLQELRQAETPDAIVRAFERLTAIHGIGETIAAKLIMYTLREIGIGRATPERFPLNVTWPLTQEWHAAGAIMQLYELGAALVPLAAGVMHQRGDGFAIDALFYLHRNHPQRLYALVEELQGKKSRNSTQDGKTAVKSGAGAELCTALLGVIKAICDDSLDLTVGELAAQGIQMKPAKVIDSNRYLYAQFEKKAKQGNPVLMVQYYEACLRSKMGKMYDDILEKVGRKSLASERERFLKVAQGVME